MHGIPAQVSDALYKWPNSKTENKEFSRREYSFTYWNCGIEPSDIVGVVAIV